MTGTSTDYTAGFVSPNNPIQETPYGTWKWMQFGGGTGSQGQAQFFPTDPATSAASSAASGVAPAVSSPSVNTGKATANGNVNLLGSGNGSVNLSANKGINSFFPSVTSYVPQAVAPQFAAPPAAPNYAHLQALQDQVERKANIAAALKSYDALSASTQASGFQNAQNAGNVYANRLMQQGVNPLASGLVAAQARTQVYGQLDDINQQKQQTRLDASNKADALAAQIASTISGLQLSYSKSLADFNQQNSAYALDLNKFNANQFSNAQQQIPNQATVAAQLAAYQKQQAALASLKDFSTHLEASNRLLG